MKRKTKIIALTILLLSIVFPSIAENNKKGKRNCTILIPPRNEIFRPKTTAILNDSVVEVEYENVKNACVELNHDVELIDNQTVRNGANEVCFLIANQELSPERCIVVIRDSH